MKKLPIIKERVYEDENHKATRENSDTLCIDDIR